MMGGVFSSANTFVSRSGRDVTRLLRGQSSEMAPPWVNDRSACYRDAALQRRMSITYPTRPSQRSLHLASRWQRPTPRSVRYSNPSRTATCSSAVCDTRHRRAGAAPDLAPSFTAVHAVTNPHRRPPPRLVATLRSARSSWLEARAGCCCFQPAASSQTANNARGDQSTSLSSRLVATLRSARSSWLEAQAGCCCFQSAAFSHIVKTQASALTIIAQDQCCCARCATRAAPAPLGSPCTTARTQLFLSFMQDLARRSQCPRWSRHSHGVFLFLLQGSNPFPGRPFFLSTCIALPARRAARTHAR